MFEKNPFLTALYLNILVVILSLLPLGPGQHISAFISLLVVGYAHNAKSTKTFTFISCFLLIILNCAIQYRLSPQHEQGLIKWMTISEKPFFLVVFLSFFFAFYPKKIKSFGSIVSWVMLICFLEPFLVETLAHFAKIEKFKYIDFSIKKEIYEQFVNKMIERTSKPKIDLYMQSLKIAEDYWGTINTIINGFYFIILTRFLGKRFLKTSLSFRQFLLPKWILFAFLFAWLALLFSQLTKEKFFFYKSFSFEIGWQSIFIPMLIVIISLFFLQGLSIIFFYLTQIMQKIAKTKEKSKTIFHRFQFLLLPLLCVLLLFFLNGNKFAVSMLFISTVCLGIFDMWFDYRKILKISNRK